MIKPLPENKFTNMECNAEITRSISTNFPDRLYFYKINYTVFERDLCKLEMKYLFDQVPDRKYLFSNKYIEPSRSPFTRECISVIYTGNSLDDLVEKILANNLSFDKFKVHYINLEDESIPYDERRKIEYIIGYNINGMAEMHNPEVELGVANVNGMWILGMYEETNSVWKFHDQKPYHYSNALGTRVARALVNIAVKDNLDCKLIDPCCGIGTVLIEALSMGIDTKGYEINPFIAENAKRNLEFFGFDDVVTNIDMHIVEERYDTAIVDLPYGLFNPTTLKEQVDIMKTTRKIANRMVIITFEDMDIHLRESGFEILDNCVVPKGKFKRYISVCK